ncbi:glycerol dehydrogenase [Gorillibacterium sp. sgz5001074]|uniref:glycerol dehydrogenase n=1 Tax=Gorillibacterium sp. sgz5001074 TaxID=3446695 RepID=UPI003F678BB9
MIRVFQSPSRYVQGVEALQEIGTYVQAYGGSGFLVASAEDQERVAGGLRAAQERVSFRLVSGAFGGLCTEAEVERLAGLCDSGGGTVVVGLGGGRALDAAKAVAHALDLPVIIVPTIASTDAPCSSLAVVYRETGELSRYLQLRRPPDVVLVDTGIIARAPVRFLVAGIGDAWSTYYEARANLRSAEARRTAGPTLAAMAVAELCRQTLLEHAAAARDACAAGQATEALERIVEANLLLSGLAFEGCGLAAAHAVHNGLTLLPEARRLLHGELVAFCVLVQLQLEGVPRAEQDEAAAFNRALGLPVCLADIGLSGAARDDLLPAAVAACSADGPMAHMPFEVTPAAVADALWALR